MRDMSDRLTTMKSSMDQPSLHTIVPQGQPEPPTEPLQQLLASRVNGRLLAMKSCEDQRSLHNRFALSDSAMAVGRQIAAWSGYPSKALNPKP